MKIAIDAGHGQQTPGKRTPDDSMREFHFNSVVADYVAAGLKEYDVEVLFTHETVSDVPLKDRTNKANSHKADVFVSIHANAFGTGGWNNVQGIETFVHTSRPRVAYELAAEIQNQLVKTTGRPSRGVKVANFHVLRESSMPAILVECGFMTNKDEAELLKSDVYRIKCASAILTGLVNHYDLKLKINKKVTLEALTTTIFSKDNKYEGFIHNGVTYAPVRQVAESAGLKVHWDGKNVTLT